MIEAVLLGFRECDHEVPCLFAVLVVLVVLVVCVLVFTFIPVVKKRQVCFSNSVAISYADTNL